MLIFQLYQKKIPPLLQMSFTILKNRKLQLELKSPSEVINITALSHMKINNKFYLNVPYIYQDNDFAVNTSTSFSIAMLLLSTFSYDKASLITSFICDTGIIVTPSILLKFS